MPDFLFNLFRVVPEKCSGPLISAKGAPAEYLCTLCDLLKVLDNIIKLITALAPLVAIAFVAWGAFYIITSGGSASRLTTGRKIITSALIGLAIVMGAWLIVSTAFLILTGSYQGPFPLPWYRIQC